MVIDRAQVVKNIAQLVQALMCSDGETRPRRDLLDRLKFWQAILRYMDENEEGSTDLGARPPR